MNKLFSAPSSVQRIIAPQQKLHPESDLAVGPFPACALEITDRSIIRNLSFKALYKVKDLPVSVVKCELESNEHVTDAFCYEMVQLSVFHHANAGMHLICRGKGVVCDCVCGISSLQIHL